MERQAIQSAEESSDAYHRIHKKLVGPATANKLLQHYDELTQSQQYDHMYQAGWAAAEAALVSTTHTTDEKHGMLVAAEDAWLTARDINQSALLKKDVPCQERLLRIDTSLPALLAFHAIVAHRFDTPTRVRYHSDMLDVARRTGNLLEYALANNSGHDSNYKGLLGEQLGVLSLSREYSGRFFPTVSLARSGTSRYERAQTHDLQILSFRRGRRNQFTPIEVKLSKTPGRYQSPVLNLRHCMEVYTPDGLFDLLTMYEQDFHDPQTLTDSEHERLDGIKVNVVSLIQSHHRKKPRIARDQPATSA